MAVATDNVTAQEMVAVMKTVGQDKCGDFYSGYTDREEEGLFVDINTGEEMVWYNWADGHPETRGSDE